MIQSTVSEILWSRIVFQGEAQPDPVYYKNREYTAAIDKRDYAVVFHMKEYILQIVLQDLKWLRLKYSLDMMLNLENIFLFMSSSDRTMVSFTENHERT